MRPTAFAALFGGQNCRAYSMMCRSRFADELEDYMSEEAAEKTLRAIVSWGRYAEVFAYDDEHAMFSLENPT